MTDYGSEGQQLVPKYDSKKLLEKLNERWFELKEKSMISDLEQMIRAIVKEGDFLLASGRRSKYYVNLRELLMTQPGAREIGLQMLRTVANFANWEVVGAPAHAGIAVVTAMLCVQESSWAGMRGFFVRKEAKEHGIPGLIEGQLRDLDNYVLVDDVGTTGQSAWQAIVSVASTFPSANCVGVAVVLDREEGAREFLIDRGVPFLAYTTISKVMGRR